ncbi:MAG: GNAT family N-acetyltransferase [Candidatus Heimdallarchaeota archaeon]|nr:MAG: GNAT family N-acetyltransferase [Candidatus Heimdallarchaeota archaeon]
MLDLSIINLSSDPLVILRRARLSDLEYIKEISHAEMDEVVPQYWNWESWFSDISKYLIGNHHKIFIIEVQKASGGYLWVNEEFNALWITAIVLQNNYQRKSIGSKIMNYLIEETHKEGKEFIELGVQHNNKNAQNFYSKLGFEQFDHIQTANTDLFRLNLSKLRKNRDI